MLPPKTKNTLIASTLLIAGIAAHPNLPNSWKAEAGELIECQNIAGCRPGVETYNFYYDYPNKQRFQYTNVSNMQDDLWDFTAKDARTGCGIMYHRTSKKCCQKVMQDSDTGACTTFAPVQITRRAQDIGPKSYAKGKYTGEDWQMHTNIKGIHQTEDWIVTAEGYAGANYQTIQFGDSGDTYITVDIDYDK